MPHYPALMSCAVFTIFTHDRLVTQVFYTQSDGRSQIYRCSVEHRVFGDSCCQPWCWVRPLCKAGRPPRRYTCISAIFHRSLLCSDELGRSTRTSRTTERQTADFPSKSSKTSEASPAKRYLYVGVAGWGVADRPGVGRALYNEATPAHVSLSASPPTV